MRAMRRSSARYISAYDGMVLVILTLNTCGRIVRAMVSSTGTGASDLAAENMSSMVAGSTKRDMAGRMLVDGRCAEDVDKCKTGDVNAIASSKESAAKTIIN